MLLVRRSDALLLERRPPAGIWGGLLTPPQFDTLEHAMKACPGRFGFSVAGYVALEPLEHGFTHYSLTIRPVVCDAPLDVAIAAEPSTAWMPIRDALEAAIPSPVRTILRRLLAQEATA
jgi:A/G-specific adenine glycosylase